MGDRRKLHRKWHNIYVLILILMEDTLWATALSILQLSASSLNPYSNGRYSMGRHPQAHQCTHKGVLILILMEDTL